MNVSKTKIVIFTNSGKIFETEKWVCNNQCREVVNTFDLGMLFNHYRIFFETQKLAAE